MDAVAEGVREPDLDQKLAPGFGPAVRLPAEVVPLLLTLNWNLGSVMVSKHNLKQKTL
jgi:hypothetical protein